MWFCFVGNYSIDIRVNELNYSIIYNAKILRKINQKATKLLLMFQQDALVILRVIMQETAHAVVANFYLHGIL